MKAEIRWPGRKNKSYARSNVIDVKKVNDIPDLINVFQKIKNNQLINVSDIWKVNNYPQLIYAVSNGPIKNMLLMPWHGLY